MKNFKDLKENLFEKNKCNGNEKTFQSYIF